MWLIQNLYGLIIVGLIGIILLIFYSQRCQDFFYYLKIKYMLGSLNILEITNKEQCKEACVFLKAHCQDLNALGFDSEWISVNGKPRPIALLQLASVHGLCCLFRLNILGGIPEELKELLCDPNIIKLGISPLNDSKLLSQDFNIQVCSTLDLRYLYPVDGGLASLASSVIGVKLNKSFKLKCSNWESPRLTNSQRDYAAKDALVAIAIFKKWLISNFKSKIDKKHKLNYSEVLNTQLLPEISRCLDVHFKTKNKDSVRKSNSNGKQKEYEINRNKIKKIKSSHVLRKSPLYHNIFMHAPDGELLCSCDRRKAEWYLERGLAEVMPGEPFSIKLLFEPSARTGETEEGRFYQQLKQNCCVVCGSKKSYLKHNVVPREYRKHFPSIMKDHQSHDIVLVCINCHQLISQHNEVFKQKLAVMCNVTSDTKVIHSREVQKIKNAANALLNAADVIPTERKTQLESQIKNYYEIDNITNEILENAVGLETKTLNRDYESHGIKVVNYFKQQDGGLIKLEKLWREHFLETMKPQYLPAKWSVSHNHSRVAQSLMKKTN